MEKEQVISILIDYETELSGILGRFTAGRHINRDDDPRFRQIVIELRDYIDDLLGENDYSFQIISFFNDGILAGHSS